MGNLLENLSWEAEELDDGNLIPVRMLNEYTYCPRLAHLEWVQGEWRENLDTIEGTIAHRRVDQPGGQLDQEKLELRESLQVRSVSMSSATLGITGKMDVVEVANGEVMPIEFKKSRCPESGPYPADKIQVAAQALILRDNGYPVQRGSIYYVGSKIRVEVALTDDLVSSTLSTIEAMKNMGDTDTPPPPLQDSPKCPRCSLVTICLPDETNLLRSIPEAVEEVSSIRRLVPHADDKNALYLTEAGTTLGKSGERLVVKERQTVLHEVRIREIDHVSIFGNIQVTTQALQTLAEHNIPITYFSSGGWFHAFTLGTMNKNVVLRQAQYRTAQDPGESLKAAREIIHGKILNCRTLLRRNGRAVPPEILRDLKALATKAKDARDLTSLLGIEGAAAHAYFSQFPAMLRSDAVDFEWVSRNRRPPKDPVNALLSLGYALLTKQMTVTLFAIGLDPFMGLMHQPKYGKPALALDLIEEFRPLIVDSTVITAINTHEIEPKHFVTRGGSTALTSIGRKIFIGAIERRLSSEITHPLFGYRVSYRRILEIQARLLGRRLLEEISAYPSFTTR